MSSLCFFCFGEIKDLHSYIKCQSCPLTLHESCYKINEYLNIFCPIKSKEHHITNKLISNFTCLKCSDHYKDSPENETRCHICEGEMSTGLKFKVLFKRDIKLIDPLCLLENNKHFSFSELERIYICNNPELAVKCSRSQAISDDKNNIIEVVTTKSKESLEKNQNCAKKNKELKPRFFKRKIFKAKSQKIISSSPLFKFLSNFLEQLDCSHLLSNRKLNREDQDHVRAKYDYDYFIYIINNEISVSDSPKKISKLVDSNEIRSIDDIFERIEKNLYLSLENFEQDFKELYLHLIKKYDTNQGINNALFSIYCKFFQMINETFRLKFDKYIAALTSPLYQSTEFKLMTQEWPMIPKSFRQYHRIDTYVSPFTEGTLKIATLSSKNLYTITSETYPSSDFVSLALSTRKHPTPCSSSCDCLNFEQFGTFSYETATWISRCPNRANKIECNHPDLDMPCFNMSIGLNLSKKEGPDVEERLCWGFDGHSRKWLEFLIQMTGKGKKSLNWKKKEIGKKIKRHMVGNDRDEVGGRLEQSKKRFSSQINGKGGRNGESMEQEVKVKEKEEVRDAYLNEFDEESKTKDNEATKDETSCNGIEIFLEITEESHPSKTIENSHTNPTLTQTDPPSKTQISPKKLNQLPSHQAPKTLPPPSSPSPHPLSQSSSSPPPKYPSLKWIGGEDEFLERSLIKALNSQNEKGYDIVRGCKFILGEGEEKEKREEWEKREFTREDMRIARVLRVLMREERVRREVRVHNKGMGLICKKQNGIRKNEFIIEYLGELYPPWRWFERQEVIRKYMLRNHNREILLDFYNIMLERHKDDPQGYNLLFVDPIHKGNFSSRLSHSCDPNCGTVTTITNGKYVIGMFALKDIRYGEELTFDYCSYTEDPTESKKAICLCGSKMCRGTYLEFTKSNEGRTRLNKLLPVFKRKKMLMKAVIEDLNDEDNKKLEKFSIRSSMLDNCPIWLKKWIANVLNVIEEENEMIRTELTGNISQKAIIFNNTENRLQNLAITVDKIKYILSKLKYIENQEPIQILSPKEIVNHLWKDSEMKRSLGKKSKEIEKPTLLRELIEFLETYKNKSTLASNIIKYIFRANKIIKEHYEAGDYQSTLKILRFLFLKISNFLRGSSIQPKEEEKKTMELLNNEKSNTKFDSSCEIILNLEEKKTSEKPEEPQDKKDEKPNIVNGIQKKRKRIIEVSDSKEKEVEKVPINFVWVADIFYFYAFTHTFFRFSEYNKINSESIEIRKCEVSNVELYTKSGKNSLEDDSKIVVMNEFVSYKNDFILGQIDKWFRQDNIEKTGLGKIAGRFVYPNIKQFAEGDQISYPFQKNPSKSFARSRLDFLKLLKKRPDTCWTGSDPKKNWTFNSDLNFHGTIFYDCEFNNHILPQNFLADVIENIDSDFSSQMNLFRKAENILDHSFSSNPKFLEVLSVYLDVDLEKFEKKSKQNRSSGCNSAIKVNSSMETSNINIEVEEKVLKKLKTEKYINKMKNKNILK